MTERPKGEPKLEEMNQETISIKSPEFDDLTHLSAEKKRLDEVIKMREDDAIMAEYVKQGLVTFIGEMSEEEMDRKAAEEGWPNNWDAAHPVYDNNGTHQQRWKIYEISPELIDIEAKINANGDLSEDEEIIKQKAEQIHQAIDEKFSPEDFYFRSAEIQKELIKQMVTEAQAEHLGIYGQTEAYEKLPGFHPEKNKKDIRIPTREKTPSGDRVFEYYRVN